MAPHHPPAHRGHRRAPPAGDARQGCFHRGQQLLGPAAPGQPQPPRPGRADERAAQAWALLHPRFDEDFQEERMKQAHDHHMTTPTPQEARATATRLLRESAEELKIGVSINGVPDWDNEPETKAAYDEHM